MLFCAKYKIMISTKIYNSTQLPQEFEKDEMVDFLFYNLQQYGDPKAAIKKAIDYSLQTFTSFGGFTMVMKKDNQVKGVVVINKTGMTGYIPENILVYIAVDQNSRGEGLGGKLMKEVIAATDGDIALHVEANNPAKKLYERLGFTNPYLEMRLKK
jgi:ribosomal-protein-alanine N-acetyltransferase